MPPSKEIAVEKRPLPFFDPPVKNKEIGEAVPEASTYHSPQVVPSDEISAPASPSSSAVPSATLFSLNASVPNTNHFLDFSLTENPFDDTGDDFGDLSAPFGPVENGDVDNLFEDSVSDFSGIPPGTICPAALTKSATSPEYQVPVVPSSPPKPTKLGAEKDTRVPVAGKRLSEDDDVEPAPKRCKRIIDVISLDTKSPFLNSHYSSPLSPFSPFRSGRETEDGTRVPRCTHVGCGFTPRAGAGAWSDWKLLVRQVVAHEKDVAAHADHLVHAGATCGCCMMLRRTGSWPESTGVVKRDDDKKPKPKPSSSSNKTSSDPLAPGGGPAGPTQTVACGHAGCPFLSRAGSYHNRKNNVRFHEKNMRLHVDHIKHCLKEGFCEACLELINSGTWKMEELEEVARSG